MRKGRRERIEKGSREGIGKETKRQSLRDPALLEFLDPTIKIWFLQAYRMHYSNNVMV